LGTHVLAGFGFGPIQAGLFVAEAYRSGNFGRLAVAEIDRELVQAIRQNNGSYCVNVARPDGIDSMEIRGVELLDPTAPSDRRELLEVLRGATDLATALPSIAQYTKGDPSVASLIAYGVANSSSFAKIIYAAENHNHAAETLQKVTEESLRAEGGSAQLRNMQFLNTVIGKMSRVVTDPAEIERLGLGTITPDLQRAFLVEEFNRILVARCGLPGFAPGIECFVEKADLLPFEEAKLYGHNAVHALLGYVGYLKGYDYMSELREDSTLMGFARAAFIEESGKALIQKYSHLGDQLFTRHGFEAYADDLLVRMTNPFLADTVERATRDPQRKLGVDDRLFGTIKLALSQEVTPHRFAAAALAALIRLMREANLLSNSLAQETSPWRSLPDEDLHRILHEVWQRQPNSETEALASLVSGGRESLEEVLK